MLEHLFTASIFNVVQYLQVRPETLYSLTSDNVILGCSSDKHSSLFLSALNEKVFVLLSPGANVIKLFCTKFTNFRSKLKLECFSLVNFSSLV
jgi:hypothetical protein